MSTQTTPAPRHDRELRALGLVDADVHTSIPREDLIRRLSPQYRRRLEEFGLRARNATEIYPRFRNKGFRRDAWPAKGLPGSDLDLMREQLLDPHKVSIGILNPSDAFLFGGQESGFAAALTTALNDWTASEWLDQDSRLRGGITIPFEDAELAVAEIARVAADPRFVHIYMPSRTERPMGHRKYWPIYEAAARHGLAITIHIGGPASSPTTGAGWPSFYLEDHVSYATSVQATSVSLICSGVFEEYPTLKFLLEEGGLLWAPSQMWALDDMWPILAAENPRIRQAPSDYFRKHFYFTTQPIEEPFRRGEFTKCLAQLDMDSHILFSSDYPHWDYDDPSRALPKELSSDLRGAILSDNARELYGLE
jgi:predicted TIM-barrel fold metal-dependent hydrolase